MCAHSEKPFENSPVVNGGSDSELKGVTYIPYIFLFLMGSQLELRIEFPKHLVVTLNHCKSLGSKGIIMDMHG